MNYDKFNTDKLSKIGGNSKEKIHDVMVEIFKQMEAGIEIEAIDGDIDYRNILLILTSKGFDYENSREFFKEALNELKEFFSEIVTEGQKKREIRQDFSTDEIVGSLIIMYMGIQYKWELYFIDDMILAFEDIFDLEWEKIRFRE